MANLLDGQTVDRDAQPAGEDDNPRFAAEQVSELNGDLFTLAGAGPRCADITTPRANRVVMLREDKLYPPASHSSRLMNQVRAGMLREGRLRPGVKAPGVFVGTCCILNLHKHSRPGS
jgi:hypothetical protein